MQVPSAGRPSNAATGSLPLRILRSTAAVLGGYLVFALSAVALFQLSGRNPHAAQPLWFMGVSVMCGCAFAAAGGFIATRIAPSHRLLHATLVALLLALGASASLIMSPATDATWSQWTALTLMAPSAFLGGWAASGRRRAIPPAQASSPR